MTGPVPLADNDRTDLHHHGDAELAPGLIDLAVNVTTLAPPVWLSTAVLSACARLDSYPDPRTAVAAVAGRHGRGTDEVLLTAGGAEAFTLIARGLPRGRAAVVHPQFTEPEVALLAAGWDVERVVLDEADGFALDPARIPHDCTVVIVGNPTNPTGAQSARWAPSLEAPGRAGPKASVLIDASGRPSKPRKPPPRPMGSARLRGRRG